MRRATPGLPHLLRTQTGAEKSSVISKMETNTAKGKNYLNSFYNFDAIIAVGYCVNSYQETQFRIRATKTPYEYIIKGFMLDDER